MPKSPPSNVIASPAQPGVAIQLDCFVVSASSQ